MKKIIFAACAGMLFISIGLGWYYGKLAPIFTKYPARLPLQTVVPNLNPMIIAHRGYSKMAPENTLPGIKAAIAAGLDYVEIDIRLSADGVPVLHHDSELERTTNGTGKLADFTFAELRELDAGSWFGGEFAGTRIPSLQEALDVTQGKACIYADIKEAANREMVAQLRSFSDASAEYCLLISLPWEQDWAIWLAMEMTEEMRSYVLLQEAAQQGKFDSANGYFLRYWPAFPYVHTMREEDSPESLLEKYPGLIAVQLKSTRISEEIVRNAHKYGLLTFHWVVTEDSRVYRSAMEAGVDALFLGDIEGLRTFQLGYGIESHQGASQ